MLKLNLQQAAYQQSAEIVNIKYQVLKNVPHIFK